MLDLAKIEARKLELAPQEINLSGLLESVVGIMRMGAQQKQLRLSYQPGPGIPPTVRADEKRLRQVLLNLLGNAVKFTERGAVTFRVTVLGIDQLPDQQLPSARLRFEVEDTGIGIPAGQRDSIFQAFEQVSDASQRAAGTGLGLAISQRIVELMGGRIQVCSELGQSRKL